MNKELIDTLNKTLSLAPVFCDSQKERNDWDVRMIRAALEPFISFPDDWNELTEDQKTIRLAKVKKELQNVG